MIYFFNSEDSKELINEVFEKLQNREWENFRNLVSTEIVFCSFSTKNDDILMWSHYTDEHKGIVIGFDSSNFDRLHRVEYKNQRPLIHFISNVDIVERQKDAETVMTTKYISWKYEDEWRRIIPRSEVFENPDNKAILFAPFDLNSVKTVICGCKMNKSQEDQIYALLSKYPNCKIQHAKIHKRNFALDIE